MRTTPPALLPLLRSQTQGELLALTFLHPDREYTLTEAAGHIGASVKSVHQEANRLLEAGLLNERRIGRLRLLRAATDNVLTEHLTGLLALTYGPLPVLVEVLSPVEGLLEAYIYGSWAARYMGEPGPPPEDVDVLAVGALKPNDLYEATDAAREILQREVNVHVVSEARWQQTPPKDPFLEHVKQRPLVKLQLEQR